MELPSFSGHIFSRSLMRMTSVAARNQVSGIVIGLVIVSMVYVIGLSSVAFRPVSTIRIRRQVFFTDTSPAPGVIDLGRLGTALTRMVGML